MSEQANAPISRLPVPSLADQAALEAAAVGDDDLATLSEHGFDKEGARDIAAAAFCGMSNRLANVTSMHPGGEFHSMGR